MKSWDYDFWASFPHPSVPWVHSFASIYCHDLDGVVHWNLAFGGDKFYEPRNNIEYKGSLYTLGQTSEAKPILNQDSS